MCHRRQCRAQLVDICAHRHHLKLGRRVQHEDAAHSGAEGGHQLRHLAHRAADAVPDTCAAAGDRGAERVRVRRACGALRHRRWRVAVDLPQQVCRAVDKRAEAGRHVGQARQRRQRSERIPLTLVLAQDRDLLLARRDGVLDRCCTVGQRRIGLRNSRRLCCLLRDVCLKRTQAASLLMPARLARAAAAAAAAATSRPRAASAAAVHNARGRTAAATHHGAAFGAGEAALRTSACAGKCAHRRSAPG
mmetsp:Transcript_8811/g.26731  ORF Transcript_8811/g.26731 Transcript_8811/m.26731 type:complete len:248 (+) Transcript_8811:225-968(+)